MATASEIQERIIDINTFLECPSCLEPFKSQICLPCNHVMCPVCIEKQTEGKETFPCKWCKAKTKVPEGGVKEFPVAYRHHALENYLKLWSGNTISDFSLWCNAETKKIEKDVLDANLALETRKGDIMDEMQNNDEHFDENKRIIHQRCLEMMEQLVQKEKRLMSDAEQIKDEKLKEYQQQLLDIDTKISSLDATKSVIEKAKIVSKLDVSVKQHQVRDIQQKAATAMEEIVPPDLSIQDTLVESLGDFDIDVIAKSHRVVKCFDDVISSIALLDEYLVALRWHGEAMPTDFFVHGKDARKNKLLKQKLELICPHACRMVASKKDGHEVLVVSEATRDLLGHIRVVNINQDGHWGHFISGMIAHALTVNRHNDIIFTDFRTPKAISKIALGEEKSCGQTIFQNKNGDNILENPWHISVNINDNIIISDSEKKSLIIFDDEGNVLNTYNRFHGGALRNPCGLCTDERGNIYVCDSNGDCIHRLDKDGNFKDFVVTQRILSQPQVVQYCNGTLVVGQGDGNVKYFDLREGGIYM